LDETTSSNHNLLDSYEGIDEWYLNNTENLIIIKYDEDIIDEDKIKKIIK
jgi:hypothetical protein